MQLGASPLALRNASEGSARYQDSPQDIIHRVLLLYILGVFTNDDHQLSLVVCTVVAYRVYRNDGRRRPGVRERRSGLVEDDGDLGDGEVAFDRVGFVLPIRISA